MIPTLTVPAADALRLRRRAHAAAADGAAHGGPGRRLHHAGAHPNPNPNPSPNSNPNPNPNPNPDPDPNPNPNPNPNLTLTRCCARRAAPQRRGSARRAATAHPGLADPRQVGYSLVRASPWTGRASRRPTCSSYATQGSNPRLATPGRSATHAFEPCLGQVLRKDRKRLTRVTELWEVFEEQKKARVQENPDDMAKSYDKDA
eukprot:scaffold71655_cov46-Phaeocystis_antarctica.AAC.2